MSESAFAQSLRKANQALGREAFSPCLEIFLYGTAERSSFTPSVLKGVSALVQRFAGSLTHYKTNTMKLPRPVGSDAHTVARNFLTSLAVKPTKLAGIQFHSGAAAEDYKLPSLAYFSVLLSNTPGIPPGRTYLRLCLPPDSAASEPSELRALCRALLQDFALQMGHCGWSFYWSDVDDEEENILMQYERAWLARFPGVSYGSPLGLLDFIGEGLLSISWLNYVSGEAAAARSLDIAALRAQGLAAGLGCELLAHEVLEVQAGPAPRTGDRNRQELLPEYHQAGRLLAPLAIDDETACYMPIAELEFDDRVAWYRRFFDGR